MSRKRKPIRIQEKFRTISTRGKHVVDKEYEMRQNGKTIGTLDYACDLQHGGGLGIQDNFEKHIQKDDAGINFVKVKRGHRNKGFGKKLLKKAERLAKKDKKKRLLLVVSPKKKKNISLYKKNGYNPIATSRRKGKWVLMAKDL